MHPGRDASPSPRTRRELKAPRSPAYSPPRRVLVPEFYEAARLARETGRARAEASRPFGARSSGVPEGRRLESPLREEGRRQRQRREERSEKRQRREERREESERGLRWTPAQDACNEERLRDHEKLPDGRLAPDLGAEKLGSMGGEEPLHDWQRSKPPKRTTAPTLHWVRLLTKVGRGTGSLRRI